MTVCVATISNKSTILGASDRMLTAADVEFEPDAPKVHALTTSIVAMASGDAALQAEIIGKLRAWVQAQIAAAPTVWIPVQRAAEEYIAIYAEVKRQRAEAALLLPLGLDSDSFINRQQELSPQLAREITTDILNFSMPGIGTIITGVDTTGPHIWVSQDGTLTCRDSVGFCAIGIGANHAQSVLMSARYGPSAPIAEALLVTFAAKKRAEVAPGVGSDTDMFIIGPAPGSLAPIADNILKDLGGMYRRWVVTERQAFNRAKTKASDYVRKINEAAAAATQGAQVSAPPHEQPPPPTDASEAASPPTPKTE